MKKIDKTSRIFIILAIVMFACAAIITYILDTKYNMAPTEFDKTVQNMFFSMRCPLLNAIVIAITHCGDTLTIVVLCIVLLLLPNRRKYGIPVTLSSLAGLAIYKPLKHLYMRARPDEILHLVSQGGFSFPSGHSTTSIIVYGLLWYLLQTNCSNKVLKNILSAVCAVLMFTIGLSRIYVGVHWPTDVLCGWLIGGGVLLVTIVILRINRAKA